MDFVAVFWNFIADSGGYNVKDIVSICTDTDSLKPEARDASVSYLINNMVRYMHYRRPYKKVKLQRRCYPGVVSS